MYTRLNREQFEMAKAKLEHLIVEFGPLNRTSVEDGRATQMMEAFEFWLKTQGMSITDWCQTVGEAVIFQKDREVPMDIFWKFATQNP